MILDYSTSTRTIAEAFEQVLATEAEKLQERFKDANGRDIFLNVVKKSSTGEWLVKAHIDGKYSEDATYYTDEKDDAIRTMASMKANYMKVGSKADLV